jgi:hypothetical protein
MIFHWENVGIPGAQYRVHYKALQAEEIQSFTATSCTHFVERPEFYQTNDTITATIEAIYPDGRRSSRSPEIRVQLTQAVDNTPDIPKKFMAKLFWANVSAWVKRNLL